MSQGILSAAASSSDSVGESAATQNCTLTSHHHRHHYQTPLTLGHSTVVCTAQMAKASEPMSNSVLLYHLHYAIQDNDLNAIKMLLMKGADVDKQMMGSAAASFVPMLCTCARLDRYEAAALLLEYGSNINVCDGHGQSALHYAINFRAHSTARLLIKRRTNLNKANAYGVTPLHAAAESNSLDTARLLLDGGAKINQKNSSGKTPLIVACQNNSFEVARLLVSRGADVNAADNTGCSALFIATHSSLNLNIALIKALLSGGACPDFFNQSGFTPLMSIIRRSSDHLEEGKEAVQELINHGCDVNLAEFNPMSYGESPLTLSLRRNQDSITEKLIRAGANVRSNVDQYTPLVYLIRDGKFDLARLVTAYLPIITGKEFEDLQLYRANLEQYDKRLFHYLYSPQPFSLQHLCRRRLRLTAGRHADRVTKSMPLSWNIKNYLLLLDL